jgi:hypothetical protein
MLLSTVYHLTLGIAGLFYDQSFPIGSAAVRRAGSHDVFGVFMTNGWHSVAALGLAAISLYFLVRPQGARAAALAIGLFHVALVVALVIWPPETFWIMSNGADQFIHSFTAVAGIGAALLTREPSRGRREAPVRGLSKGLPRFDQPPATRNSDQGRRPSAQSHPSVLRPDSLGGDQARPM